MNDTTQLSSRLAAVLDQPALDHMSAETGIEDQKVIHRAVNLALPSVVENLHNLARTEQGEAQLNEMLTNIRTRGVDGAALSGLLFGDRLADAAQGLGAQCQLNPVEGASVLQSTSAWALTTAASMVDNPQSLTRVLSSRGVIRDSEDARRAALAQSNEAEVTAQAASAPTDTTASETGRASDSAKPPWALIGAGLTALLFLGGLFVVATGGGDDGDDARIETTAEQTDQGVDDASTSVDPADAPDASPASSTSEAPASDPADASAAASEDQATNTSTEPVAATTDEMVSPTITMLSVPMRDIKGTDPDASGTLDFSFDTLTGQICYEVGSLGVNPPYASHIHAGNFGVKGGVVVDLGMLDNGATGCVDNLPADTLAILAQPSRHYAELHDASGDWTVRGQLSETIETQGIVPLSIPMRDILGTSPSASGVLSFEFNTITGEVCYSVFSVGVEPPFRTHIHEGPFGVKGGVVLDMGGQDSGNAGCVENPLTDTLAILADPAGHYAEIHDVSEEWTVRGQLTETIENPGIVSLAVPMVDIKNVEPSAQGILAFDFNTVTGQICYDVAASNISGPFNSHIHAGDYGIKGGVVVDLGGLQDGAGGCVDNSAADTLAILADPSGHYAELHDAGGEWTIRGQLSEATNAIDPASNNLLIDTDGGGASMRLESGTIYLEGNIDNDAVAAEMVASLEGISTPIVNNLQIVAGSPLPSGRVVIGDNVFFDTGSDDINQLPAATVTALVEIGNSRPDWVIAVVGHTDNVGSDVYNLELSLRRAEALRRVLVSQGMNSENIRIRGAGETKPIADNSNEAGRALNRRIEFEFTPA